MPEPIARFRPTAAMWALELPKNTATAVRRARQANRLGYRRCVYSRACSTFAPAVLSKQSSKPALRDRRRVTSSSVIPLSITRRVADPCLCLQCLSRQGAVMHVDEGGIGRIVENRPKLLSFASAASVTV